MLITSFTKSHQITKHFKVGEMSCKCGCNQIPSDIWVNIVKLCEKLEEFRIFIGNKPITIISQYRCYKRNKIVGGAPKSQHLYGRAVDIVVDGMTPKEVYDAAIKFGFRGVGVYDTFCHVDIRKSLFKAKWDKRKK